MEALPNDPAAQNKAVIKGVNRSKEPVTIGIPFPFDTFFFKTDQFLLTDNGLPITDLQVKIVRRFASTRVKWALLDFQVTLKANEQKSTFELNQGTLPMLPTKLARDEGDKIVVSTGAATFWINKKQFNLIDKVEVDGKELISPGTSPGIILTDSEGKTYEGRLDPGVQVQIEDNGPIRSSIVARGTHTASDKSTRLGFTVRMHFYKGKQRVRLLYTLRNASKAALATQAFKSVELALQSSLKQPQYTLSSNEGEQKGSLATGEQVSVFQGENNTPLLTQTGWDKKSWPTGISGYKIEKAGTALKSGTREQPIKLFYAQASEAQGAGVTVGTRFASGHWPQALSVSADGRLHIGVFPKGNDKPYAIRYGSHITHEHFLYFQSSAASPRDEFFRFQYPLVGKPTDPGWFNAEGMLLWRLVSFAKEAEFAQQRGWPVDDKPTATLNRRPSFAVVRHLDHSTDTPGDQFSKGMLDAFNFLREESPLAGAYYLMAEQRMGYNAGQALLHSDDFNATKIKETTPDLVKADGTIKTYTDLPGADLLPSTSPLWTHKNPHGYGLGFWHFLTGERRFAEAYFDWGETQLRVANTFTDLRTLSWNIFNLSDLHIFAAQTGSTYLQEAWKLIEGELLNKEGVFGQSSGWERTRGYVVGPNPKAQSTLQTFVQGGVLARALAQFIDYAATDPEQSDRSKDVLEGLARFVNGELWFLKEDKPGLFGFVPGLDPGKALTDPTGVANWQGGVQDAFVALYYGYILTCEVSFRERSTQLLRAMAYNQANLDWFQDRSGRHMLQEINTNPGNYFLWHDLPIKAEKQGDGSSYKLSWQVPEFAVRYWIKYADKTIVPSLGYNPTDQSFAKDPKTHVAFYAATNAIGEPNPGDVDPKQTQTMLVENLDPNKSYSFAARYQSRELCKKAPNTGETGDADAGPGGETNPQPDGGGDPQKENGDQVAGEQVIKDGCGCHTNDGSGLLWMGLLLLAGGLIRRKTQGS